MASETGKIVKWNAEKGFGFIRSESTPKDIFVHRSAFGRIPRRPQVGDTIYMDEIIEDAGKRKVTRARILGVTPVAGKKIHKKSKKTLIGYIVAVVLVIVSILMYTLK